jgi:hypothetical protein
VSWIIDIGKHVATELGSSFTWGTNVFAEHMPPSPDAVVVLRDAGGQMKPGDVPSSKLIIEVYVRAATVETAMVTSESIWAVLAFKHGFTANLTTRIISSEGESKPRFLEFKQKRLAIVTARYSFEIEHSKY